MVRERPKGGWIIRKPDQSRQSLRVERGKRAQRRSGDRWPGRTVPATAAHSKNCFGSLGLALEAGLELTNLTEHQFGIGTRRTEFPWNSSGTYVQVMPYVQLTDDDGKEYNFLADYYRTTQELVSNVFRKGYQWPFHASRLITVQVSSIWPSTARLAKDGR